MSLVDLNAVHLIVDNIIMCAFLFWRRWKHCTLHHALGGYWFPSLSCARTRWLVFVLLILTPMVGDSDTMIMQSTLRGSPPTYACAGWCRMIFWVDPPFCPLWDNSKWGLKYLKKWMKIINLIFPIWSGFVFVVSRLISYFNLFPSKDSNWNIRSVAHNKTKSTPKWKIILMIFIHFPNILLYSSFWSHDYASKISVIRHSTSLAPP